MNPNQQPTINTNAFQGRTKDINQQVYNVNKINNEQFDFYLPHTNRIKPKSLKKTDIIHLIRSNNTAELNELLSDLSQENFEENDYFEFNRDELKLIKSYQILTQYMLYSINHLTRNNQLLNEMSNKQVTYNQEAEVVLKNQQKKIKEQEEVIGDLTNNCINMEYLIKQLDLEKAVQGLGVNMEDKNTLLNSKDFDRLRNENIKPNEGPE